MRFVVLSSSRGTTFQAVLDRIADGSLTAQCLGLVTDRPDRGCIEKAKAANVPFKIVEKKEGELREEYDRRLDVAVKELAENREQRTENDVTIIAAMGWMSILTPWFIQQWANRIINVHPALLPKFGGEKMYGNRVHQAVLDAKAAESGITIHVMDEGVDTGKILVQKNCSVEPTDTVDSLKAKVQALEKEWYPKVLQMIESGEMKV